MYSILIELYKTSGFLNMLLFSFLLGGAINFISFSLSLSFINQISRNKIIIFVFAIGLFFLFSLSPVIKVLVLNKFIKDFSLLIVGLYCVHLIPLYTLIYLFTFSFVNTQIFNYTKCQKIGYFSLFKHFFRKILGSFLIFWNFAFVFILFDISKNITGHPSFSFHDVSSSTPSYITHFSQIKTDFINILPIVILLLPSIFIEIFVKKTIKLSSDFSNLSVFIPNFEFLKGIKKRGLHISNHKTFLLSYILGTIPLILYLIFTFSLINITSLNLEFLGKTFLSCVIISVITIYTFVLLCFFLRSHVKARLLITYFLFILALLPGDFIGSFINHMGKIHELNFSLIPLLEVQTFVGFLLYYGIFPFFFLNISISESEETLKLGDNYKLSFIKKLNLLFHLNNKGIILSLVFFAVLICNDSTITSSITITNMDLRSIAFNISNSLRNQTNFDNLLPILLIIVNFFLIFFAPFYSLIVEKFHLLPFNLFKMHKLYKS